MLNIIKLLIYCLMGLCWLIPNHTYPLVTFYKEIAIAMFMALFFLGYKNIKIPNIFYLPAIIAVLPILQIFFGLIIFPGDAWVISIYLFVFGLSICLGFNTNEDGFTNISFVLLFVGIISVFISIAQWLNFEDTIGAMWVLQTSPGARPYANLGQPNNLATLLGLSLAALFFLIEKKQLPKILSGFFAAILIFGLVLAQSRTTWVVALALPCMVAILQRKNTILHTIKNRTIIHGTVLFFGLVVCLPWLSDLLNVSTGSALEHASQSHRWEMYKQALYIISQAPWYGYGWGQIEVTQALLTPAAPHAIFYHYSHNLIIDLMLWNGWFIGLLITGLLFFYLYKIFIKTNTLIGLCSWIGLLFFGTHSMLEYPYAYLFLLLPAGFLIGIIDAHANNTQTKNYIKFSGVIIGIPILIVTAIFWRDYLIIEKEYIDTASTITTTFTPEEEQAASKIWIMTGYKEIIYFLRMPIIPNYSEEQLEIIETMALRHPNKSSLIRASYIFAMNGNIKKSKEYLLQLNLLFGPKTLEGALKFFQEKSKNNPELTPLLNEFVRTLPQ